MPIDVSALVTDFRSELNELLEACKGNGVEMRPYFGIRSPFEQARFWRQSRTWEEIMEKIEWLRSQGAPFLAECLESVGPQNGPQVTNALPGLSWHQWGEAVDCVWVVDGKSEWSTQKKASGINGFSVYADQASALGLDPGGHWKSLKDWPHVQLRKVSSPAKIYSIAEIDNKMKAKFG